MGTLRLKVARIGNSRGVRLPAASLRRYRIGDTVLMEERQPGNPPASDRARSGKALVGGDRTRDGREPRGLERVGRDGRGRARPIFPGAQRSTASRSTPSGYRPKRAPSQATVKRYEIRWTALDPTQGAEMAKTRPAVIVSLDALNKVLDTVAVFAR